MTSADESMAALDRAIAGYPHRLAEVSERVAAAGSATFTGQDEGGLVTVTVSGAGAVLSVRAGDRALRDLTGRELGERVATAVNLALGQAEAAVAAAAEQTGAARPGAEDEALRLREFEQRMDATLDQLDRLDRALDRLID